MGRYHAYHHKIPRVLRDPSTLPAPKGLPSAAAVTAEPLALIVEAAVEAMPVAS